MSPPDHSANAFEPVADLIAPDPPDWLPEHLLRWSSTIFISYAVEWRQPTRAEMVKILGEVRDAAAFLQRELGQPSLREFLDVGGSEPLNASTKFQTILAELQVRADRASKLSNLVDDKGRARAGRSRAQPDGAISAQAYCALLVAEAWKWFRREISGASQSSCCASCRPLLATRRWTKAKLGQRSPNIVASPFPSSREHTGRAGASRISKAHARKRALLACLGLTPVSRAANNLAK